MIMITAKIGRQKNEKLRKKGIDRLMKKTYELYIKDERKVEPVVVCVPNSLTSGGVW